MAGDPKDASPGERLKAAREKARFKSARAAAIRYHWAPSTYASHENGTRDFGPQEAKAYAKAFKTTPEWLLLAVGGPEAPRTVKIVGLAGAGPDGSVSYEDGDGELGETPAPRNATESTVALEVRGDSMLGIAEDGWLIFYDDRREPPTEDLLGRLCVVGLADRRVMIKKLYRGRKKHHFDLESVAAPILRDVRVEWAARVISIEPR